MTGKFRSIACFFCVRSWMSRPINTVAAIRINMRFVLPSARPHGKRRAAVCFLELEKDSDRRLCDVSELIETQTVDRKIRGFVEESAVFRSEAEVSREIEVCAASIHKRHPRLTLNSRSE